TGSRRRGARRLVHAAALPGVDERRDGRRRERRGRRAGAGRVGAGRRSGGPDRRLPRPVAHTARTQSDRPCVARLMGPGMPVLMLAPAHMRKLGVVRGEFYILTVAGLAGMMLLVTATSLITVFLGVELLSIALYVLSAFVRTEARSQEAGLKYLLIGGFASG